MIIVSKSNHCNTMADTQINEQFNPNSNEYYYVTKTECDVEETIAEVVGEIDHMGSNEFENPNIHTETVYYDEAIKANEDSIDDFDPDINSVLKKKVKHEWDPVLDDMEDRIEEENTEERFLTEEEENRDEDEETIATFVTSTGQQLALYAVEDSDEVFAVAEYDDSGEPPTNFQFLMKSDVEKLIGEGAVRTVRKPSQMKKQTYRGHHQEKEEFFQEDYIENNDTYSIKTELIPVEEEIQEYEHEEKTEIDDVENDLSYQELVDTSYVIEENLPEYITSIEDFEPQEEVVQESTVQNIFHDDDDQSDSELTFDDIEKSLATFGKNNVNSRSLLKKSYEPITKSPERPSINGAVIIPENFGVRTALISKAIIEKPSRRVFNSSGMLKSKHMPRALLGRKGKLSEQSRQTIFIHGSTALICCPIEKIEPELKIVKGSTDSGSKIKRPRKQQLTAVDRADSEIIIQPASLVEEQEEEPVPRKRGRRKKKRTDFALKSYTKQHLTRSKRSRIEVIDIDIDEEQDRDIEEITIDDSKEKESSDKENEVIMVDSDDEDSQEEKQNSLILKCEHCSRSFRQKRALDTHSRVCPKSPTRRRRIEKGNRSRSNDSSTNKKQYVCKICSETFDVVVALARHARSHKKKSTAETERIKEQNRKEENEMNEKIIERKKRISSILRKKKKLQLRKLWKVKKMCCTECGKWFASSAMLSAHCLRHSTKRSEQQIKRCQLCRKLFRSNLMFMRHMKMHERKYKLQKQLRSLRQSTNIITNIRKRGRPRKL
ncbi:myb-like protein X [Chelonus insularis]|uniref:myb-like protein X n=1 Tax=Chelonus insularis TaxID=460826 RepID=UPI00158A7118|nr:myb-like protein X [Chelonus insularis]